MRFNNATYVKTALTYASTKFPKEDHHLNDLKGKSLIQDHGKNYGDGDVLGSVFIYNGDNRNVLCAIFDSNKIHGSGRISFGSIEKNFNPDDYMLACFINQYKVTYGVGKDHHLLEIEESVQVDKRKLICEDGYAFVRVSLESHLTDNGKHIIDIPTNSISGFFVAFRKDCKREIDRSYDRSVSSSDDLVIEKKEQEKRICSIENTQNNDNHVQNIDYRNNNNTRHINIIDNRNNNNTRYVTNDNGNYTYNCNCCLLI
ncbi:hypothetical protein M9Y10_028201 [Tritrichomonas musculus]|uniref:Uncharacterized protein n=1 Tax=Tritrichomonas musculus TaxID=1915356 RepID=A0ABR2KIM9_9EUKA